jgi:hypothetical protein
VPTENKLDPGVEAKAILARALQIIDEFVELTGDGEEGKVENGLSKKYGFSPEAFLKIIQYLRTQRAGVSTAIFIGIALERSLEKNGN